MFNTKSHFPVRLIPLDAERKVQFRILQLSECGFTQLVVWYIVL